MKTLRKYNYFCDFGHLETKKTEAAVLSFGFWGQIVEDKDWQGGRDVLYSAWLVWVFNVTGVIIERVLH